MKLQKKSTLSSNRYQKVYLKSKIDFALSKVHTRAVHLFLENKCSFVLDIGCGNGQLVKTLIDNGIKAVGCDYINYNALYPNSCLSWLSGRCIVACCRMLPFKEKYFDGVALLGVLNYLSANDMDNCLKQISNLLSKGGLLVITTNSSLNRIGNALRGFYYGRTVADSNYYSKSLYLEMLQKHKFRPVDIFYSLNTPFVFNLFTLLKYIFYPFLRGLWIIARKI